MSEAAALAGAAMAWLGVTLLAVSEGRRGVALGLVLAAAGLGAAAGAAGQPPLAAVALLLGGLVAAVLRLRGGGGPGWDLLPPGSTPRLMASLLALVAAGLVAGFGLGSPAAAARVGALVVAALAGARILTTERRWAALGAGSALALGLGALGGVAGLAAGAAVAAGLGAIDGAERPVEAGG